MNFGDTIQPITRLEVKNRNGKTQVCQEHDWDLEQLMLACQRKVDELKKCLEVETLELVNGLDVGGDATAKVEKPRRGKTWKRKASVQCWIRYI